MNFSIIIPCYNCEKTISDIIIRCLEYTPNVIVVNDGSKDKSLNEIKKTKAVLINNPKNHGVGFSIITGINKALKEKCDVFITLDADGAHNTKNIPHFLNKHLSENNDMTIGDRWIENNDPVIYPSTKILSNKFASSLINHILCSNFNDVSCGFRIINKIACNTLLTSKTNRYDFLYDSIFILHNKFKIGSCKVDCIYNAEELFLTRNSELLGLLDVSISYTQIHSTIFNSLIKIKKKVLRNEKIYIEIEKSKMIAHPIPKSHGYFFQFQNPCYSTFTPDISL